MTVRYWLQRDRSDEKARYAVYDGRGRLKYCVKGTVKPSGEVMWLCDENGTAAGKIVRLGFNTFSVYRIRTDHETVRLGIAAASGRARVTFSGISFSIRGDVLSGSYEIIDADATVIASASKDFMKSCVQLTVNQEERELFCIGAAICIDSLTTERVPMPQMT